MQNLSDIQDAVRLLKNLPLETVIPRHAEVAMGTCSNDHQVDNRDSDPEDCSNYPPE
mgnify:CR=1 FL=1